jgi:hypothetical protein
MQGIRIRPLHAAGITFALAVVFATAAWAHHYRLESLGAAKPFLMDGKVDTVIEPSCVAPIGDGRRMLVADGRRGSLLVVELATGAIVGAPLGSAKFPTTTKFGPNWKGMAQDSEGNYYLVGSHSGKSDEERAASSAVVKFRLKGGETAAIDDESVVRWDLSRALEAALRTQGLDSAKVAERAVEGLAVREGGGRRELVIGLGKPDDKVRALAADITNFPSPDTELELRPVFAFDAGRSEGAAEQLTSMEYVADIGGFLVLTATVGDDGASRGNTIWYVANGERRRATQHGTFERGMKSAGLAVLGSSRPGGETLISLVFTYDNDAHGTKIPGRFQTAMLVHPRR